MLKKNYMKNFRIKLQKMITFILNIKLFIIITMEITVIAMLLIKMT